ncbi:L1 [Ailuropoda melanoleuca papillomavirus 1]|uniref:Major capsid protein L1 n=1 Tax=Ailuropoda melanoleuca papillomavirus 1 TaxID=2016454 RepID=A0A220IGF5_9PAPI|nr:L1 [Ailuropoda melanoleuca papillomavirus 1]ASH99056.1 L1 [Ailuropoda melanoleuca papillomavirus 1]
MALWLPSTNKVYLPPTSVSRVLSTDEYVTRLPFYYYATSSRLLAVGHPYFPVKSRDGKVVVPKVSPNQYRVFRVKLPDPNRFGLPDSAVYDPDKERLVWGCVGIEMGRGQPLGIGLSGNPLFNKLEDTENPTRYNTNASTDNRQNVAIDPKQTQLFMVGCTPPLGEHWSKGLPCDDVQVNPGDCPPLELINSLIEDGDMFDTGFGAMDFKRLQDNKSDAPIDISQSVCKYPDYLKMCADQYGDSLFFYVRKEQMFSRHFFSRAGTVGEPIPDELVFKAQNNQNQQNIAGSVYFATPSGSLVSSESQIFNRPYWIQKAQGHNNGICWNNEIFITVADNTRSTNLTISVTTNADAETYTATEYKQYMRHAEEYEIQLLMQVCKVPLTSEVMAYVHTMNPDILDNWNLGITPPLSSSLEDTYRYLQSTATRCPAKVPPKEKIDHYDKFNFWSVDLTDKFSSELDQYPLGRKFMLQTGIKPRSPKIVTGVKRSASSTAPAAKRRRR